MLETVFKTIDKVRDKRRASHLVRSEHLELPGSFPELLNHEEELAGLREEYHALHTHYTTSVSDTFAAISLPQVALLAWLVRTQPFQRILDTGSGFSSFVLRREAMRKTGVTHYAVEDNIYWLGRTKEFLAGHDLPSDQVLSWDEFQADTKLTGFDFAYHDMGNMTTRIISLPEIERRASPSAWLILDDMHKAAYWPHAQRMLGDRWIVQSLVELTLDEHDRYAYICRRKP